MKVIKNKQLFLFCYIIGLISCTDESSTPCNFQDTMLISSTASDPCLESGSIEIKEPVGTNFQYQIDNEPFQNNVLFSKVKVGKHVLVAKDENGCEVIKEVIIDTVVPGSTFKQVRKILSNRCISCHSGYNPQAGLDFTKSCDIINNWDRIEARAVKGIPSPMPQTGLIPQDERNKIIEWISKGHKYQN
jgi:hypothetical protein